MHLFLHWTTKIKRLYKIKNTPLTINTEEDPLL